MKKKQFLLPLLMAIVMMAISPQKVWALGGSGTSSSSYTIANASDLVAFANKVNGGETGAYAKLTADITLTGAWTPIGNSSKIYTGTFDGQGHKISGLSLTATAANAGLFGYVNGATIKNFTLAGTVSSNSDNVGSVVGYAKGNSSIKDIVSTVNITMTAAKSHLGGIAGNIENGTSVLGCTYSGTLNAGSSSDSNGGIVGFANANCSGSIKYCFFNGTITTTSSSPVIGGILGYTNDESKNFSGVQNCYSCGTLSFGTSAYKYSNAIVGQIRAKSSTTINNTFLSGTAARACNEDCADPVDFTKNTAITISVTANANGSVSQSYVNPTSTAATQLQVVATPDAHYHLNKWNDNGAQTHNVGLTADVDLSASFAIDQHTITLGPVTNGTIAQSGNGTYNYGSTVTLTATPASHYHFVQWSDGDTNASRSITVTEDKTYTATFAIDQHTITVNVASGQSSMGTVSGGGTYNYGSQQTIKATAKTGYHFEKWNDGDTNASRTITVTENKTYTATFAPNQYTITVNVASDQSDMGTVSGGGTFDYNSTTTITATPKAHYHFVKWNDGNTNASRTITVTGNATYTATFAIDQHDITVKANNADYGTVTGTGKYDYNSKQTITATPKEHYHFVKWNDGNTNALRSITVTGNATYIATFAIDQHDITVKANDDNYGTVTGSGTFDYGTEDVTISATPANHYHFVQWNDGNTDNPRVITVTGDETYTATFAIDQHTITLGTDPNGSIGQTGDGTYDYNASVTLTATAADHYHFVEWSDGNTDNPRTITVTGDATYSATFAIDQHQITVQANDDNYGTVTGSGTFDYGTEDVTITATPANHYHFVQWNDGNTDNPRVITVTGDETYTATFAIDQHTLTVAANNPKMGSVTGTGTYEYGTEVTLTATPKEGCDFMGWSDGVLDATRTFTVTANATDTAIFAQTRVILYDGTLTFYHDGIDHPGTTYQLNTGKNVPDWYADRANITNVFFDESFADVRLTTCYSWFKDCENLASVDGLEILNTSEVTDMGFMFTNCSSLTLLELNHFDTSKVEDMEDMFCNCSLLYMLIIGNFDMQKVPQGTSLFSGCGGLNVLQFTSLPYFDSDTFKSQFMGEGKWIIIDLDENSVIHEDIDYLDLLNTCRECNHYNQSQTAPSVHVGATCSMAGYNGKVCSYCTQHFDKIEIDSESAFGHIFDDETDPDHFHCTHCDHWLIHYTTTGDDLFLDDIDFVWSFADLVTHVFDTETQSGYIELEKEVKKIAGIAFKDCDALKTITLPNTVTNIGLEVFSHCTALDSIELPSSLTRIGVNAFSGCESLKSIELPGSLTRIDWGAFRGCTALDSISIPSGVTDIPDELFACCTSLKTVSLPSSVTSIGMNAFLDCSALDSIELPSSLTRIDVNAFNGCESLKSIELPGSLTRIDWGAFRSCTALDSISIPSGVTDIPAELFACCTSLKTVSLPSSVTSIGMNAFLDCHSLTNLSSEYVTVIDTSAFCRCRNLETVDCPNAVSIGLDAFMFCEKLAELTVSCKADLSDANVPETTTVTRAHAYGNGTLTDTPDADGLYAYVSACDYCGTSSTHVIKDFNGTGNHLELTANNEDGNITYMAEKVIIEDGKPISTPVPFITDIVSMARTFTQSTSDAVVPATIMLPFSIEASALATVDGDVVTGTKFYGFTSLTQNAQTGKWEANMDRVTGTVEAYTPYMIVLTEGTAIDFGSTEVTFPATPATLYNTTQGDWTFVATNEAKVWTDADFANGEVYYGFAAGNETTPEGKFVKVGAGASIDPLRAYIMKTPAAGPANAPARAMAADQVPSTITVRLNEESSTGIGTLNTETGQFTFDGWYDLQGRRISEPVKGGISINNNKKIIVR